MKKDKNKGKLSHVRSLAPGNVPHDQEVFNKSVDFSSTSSSSASSTSADAGGGACESLELPDVEIEPLTQNEIQPEETYSDRDGIIASMLTQSICDQWQKVNDYRNMVKTCEDQGYAEIAEVLQSIVSDQTTHIGKLQKSLESILPTIQLIDQGEANAEMSLNEELETIDDEQKDRLEKALGVILSATQENYIYDKWREFYEHPEEYPKLVDVIKDKMTKDGVFVESVFNRKLDEDMNFKNLSKEKIVNQIKSIRDIEMTDVVKGTEEHYDNYDSVMKDRSKDLDKDGGILGAKNQPVPDKVTYPKSSLEEKYMSTKEFNDFWDADQEKDEEDREFQSLYSNDEMDADPKKKEKNDKYLQDLKQTKAKEMIDSDLDLPDIYEVLVSGISEPGMKYLGIDCDAYKKVENNKTLDFQKKDSKFRELNEESDENVFKKFGVHAQLVRRDKKTDLWSVEFASESEDTLKEFLAKHGLSTKTIQSRKDISKSSRAATEKVVKDLRYMIQAELSTDAGDGYNELIFPQKPGSPNYVSASDRYKSELTGLPTRDRTSLDFELSITYDGYMVHVDKPERLDFAKKVAQAYKKFGLQTKEYEAEPWRRVPNERYKMEFIIPEWTDGIDIGSAAAKKRYAGMEDATSAMKEFAGVSDEAEVAEEPTTIKNYKSKSIFKN